MKLLYFATLRLATKKSEEDWTAPAPTLRVLMTDLIARYGREFGRWVVGEDGELSGLAIVLLDGIDVRGKQGLDTPLAGVAEVAIFPPVAGG